MFLLLKVVMGGFERLGDALGDFGRLWKSCLICFGRSWKALGVFVRLCKALELWKALAGFENPWEVWEALASFSEALRGFGKL